MDGVIAVSLRVEQAGRGPVVSVAGELDIATPPNSADASKVAAAPP